jgi:hypothetical protein
MCESELWNSNEWGGHITSKKQFKRNYKLRISGVGGNKNEGGEKTKVDPDKSTASLHADVTGMVEKCLTNDRKVEQMVEEVKERPCLIRGHNEFNHIPGGMKRLHPEENLLRTSDLRGKEE